MKFVRYAPQHIRIANQINYYFWPDCIIELNLRNIVNICIDVCGRDNPRSISSCQLSRISDFHHPTVSSQYQIARVNSHAASTQ